MLKCFYLCHSFDIGTRLDSFALYEKRESLTSAPHALRYRKIEHETLSLWISELGCLIAFQPIPKAGNLSEAYAEYRNNFDSYYAIALKEAAAIAGKSIEAETSFLVCAGAQELAVDWKAVHLPPDDLSISIFLEATFIDLICRVVDKRSQSFVGKSSLATERLVVEYVENLFPLAIPAGFLVAKDEIKQMELYYSAWQLSARVAAIRGRFSESVTNTALYRGHLDRHSQNAMNSLLAAIAVLSLAQVSEAISDTVKTLGVCLSQDYLNRIFAAVAIALLAWGFIEHIFRPKVSLLLDDARRKYVSWRILRKRN